MSMMMSKVKKIVAVLFIAIIIAMLFSTRDNTKSVKKNEAYYQKIFCEKLEGRMEFVLSDRTRIDCLTDDYAIEVDWAKKWAEGIGQSLFYAEMTNKKAGVALIVSEQDQRYLKRINRVADRYDIKVFLIKVEE